MISKILTVFSFGVFLFACPTAPERAKDTAGNQDSGSNVRLKPVVAANPFPSRDIDFVSADDVTIVGTFYESAEVKSPAVLLLHQWQSDRSSYSEFAEALQKTGFGVLAIDGRGFGESVKTADGKPVTADRSDAAVASMKKDVDNAFRFLSEQNNVDPDRIGIVGASYGSSLALIYAAANPKVKSVVLLSPGINYFGNMPTEPAANEYGDRPMLLVAAADDKESADAIGTLQSAGENGEYEIKIYPKGGHGTAIFDVDAGLSQFLAEFLKKSL